MKHSLKEIFEKASRGEFKGILAPEEEWSIRPESEHADIAVVCEEKGIGGAKTEWHLEKLDDMSVVMRNTGPESIRGDEVQEVLEKAGYQVVRRDR